MTTKKTTFIPALGKRPAQRDARTVAFASILAAALPPIPAAYDFDKGRKIPLPMFANDKLGDCVIAGRAHQTMRFENVEQRKVIRITDKEVVDQYFKETGGRDSGLVVLSSLKRWRKEGWTVAGKVYKVDAFASINPRNHADTMAAVFLLTGIGCGLRLPKSAQAQWQNGKTWDVVSGDAGRSGSWGGHYVHVPAYNATGPVCVTWGKRQQMTWAFWDKYCDEAYGIVDALDAWVSKPGIDVAKLKKYLDEITK